MRERKGYSVGGRRGLRKLSTGLALLVALSLLMTLAPASEAAPATTTISVEDENGPVQRARVTVFDARNGRQIVNGLTDTGQLTFRSSKRRELIAVVLTSSRFLGTARVMPGRSAVVLANQHPETVPLINDPERTGALTITDAEGAPIADASITLVGTRSFESADRGGTDESGRFNFRVPDDSTEIAYLATLWTEDGEISLVGVLTFAGRPTFTSWLPGA